MTNVFIAIYFLEIHISGIITSKIAVSSAPYSYKLLIIPRAHAASEANATHPLLFDIIEEILIGKLFIKIV